MYFCGWRYLGMAGGHANSCVMGILNVFVNLGDQCGSKFLFLFILVFMMIEHDMVILLYIFCGCSYHVISMLACVSMFFISYHAMDILVVMASMFVISCHIFCSCSCHVHHACLCFYWYHTYLFACMCVVMSSVPLKLRPKCETCQTCDSLLKWMKVVRDVC